MSDVLDLLVVGAGPTGIAIGAEARRRAVGVLVMDRGPITAAIQGYPTFMEFFTTRDRLEIADIPFTIPDDKPTRRQALSYYRMVVDRYQIPLALYEEVLDIRKEGEGFAVSSLSRKGPRELRARAVALATGYFGNPRSLGVPGEDLPWVSTRYKEAYPHYRQDVVVVGAGNTAAEAALDLWRNGARVTLVHRGPHVKPGVKYWVKPDIENRIEEGSIAGRFNSLVRAFRNHPETGVEIEGPGGVELLPAQAAYVLVGYTPEVDLLQRAGVRIDPESLEPTYDPATCESNVPGLYVAGTIQAGRRTDRIFIENSRDHGPLIVDHLVRRFAQVPALT
ncbi:MAG TPA: YpdA family putative bacillithiol disulfide reductase [Thermoanaerobaculia bacterium]|jgi:thioredoxin reductase (NADPH)|nr:YpdA family putative bacillithiol disulfide reductase [Thermoanaerobaculia bacterium]